MSHRHTARVVSSRDLRRIARTRRLYLGTLEDRVAPAVFSGAGPTLAIDLNSANEVATFSTDGATVTVNLTNGTATTGGTSVTGGGTSTATFLQSVYTGTITITDSAAGTSVAFGDSNGFAYVEPFAIALDDPTSGNITFTGSSTFNQTLAATTTAGRFVSDLSSSLTVSGGGSNLSLTATNHDILLAGTLNIGGTTSFTGVTVQADNTANDFVGSLALTGPAIGSIFDVNNLDLAASSFNFALATTVQITANGNITQSGALTSTVVGPNPLLALTSTSGSITLANAGNSLNGLTAVALSVSGANTATIVNGANVNLGNVKMGTDLLSVQASGSILQQIGTTIETDGPITGTIATNNRDFSLFNAGNRIAGTITVGETGPGFVRDVSVRNADDNASLPVGTPMTTPGDIRNLSLFFDNNGIALAGYNISSNLAVTAGGDITQAAALTIGGTTTVKVLGDFAITLTNAANNFTGAVSVSAAQSTQPLQVTNSVALTLGASDLGRGTFNATAVTGNITSTAGITQRKGAGIPTFTVTAGNTINLTGPNDFPGPVNFAGVGLTTVSVRNADFQAKVTDVTGTLPATVTDLTLAFDNAAAVLPAITINNLTVNALGIVQQSGTSLVISGAGTFAAGAYALNLSNAGNDFNNINLGNSGRNDVTVTDANILTFSGNSNIGTGRCTVTAAGNINTIGTGRITQANAGPVGDVNLASTGGSITLTNNNTFRGVLSVSVSGANNVSITNNNVAMVLGTDTVPGGTFGVNAGSGAISQDPNSVLNLGGASSFTSGTAITLTNRTNTFGGPVSLFGVNASVRATGPVILGATSLTGSLSIKTGGTAADSITQTAPINGGSAATFDVGAGNVTLTNPANDFGSVSVTSTGTAVSITDTNVLNVGNIVVGGGTLTLTTGGNLGLVGTTSGIVQTTGNGAIALNVPAGNNISLGTAVNVLNGTVTVVNANNNVTLQTQGDLTFVFGAAITGNVTLTAGGALSLPANLTSLTNLTVSAHAITDNADVTASGFISFNGAVTFGGTRNITSGGAVTFTGDVTAGGGLTFTLPAANTLTLNDGTWSQGANALTINGPNPSFSIGDNTNFPARFIMTGGTITIANNGALNIGADGTLQVGNNPAASESVTVANGSGFLTVNGSIGVGFGATPDELIKTGTGPIVLGATSTLAGSGLTTATNSPVLAAETYVAGHFANSVDTQGNSVDFFAGSDIVTPTYFLDHVEVKAGGTVAVGGTATGFLPDGDKFTVSSSLGAAAGLATVVDPNGQLYVVVRNTTAAGASTLNISTTGGGDGQIPMAGLSVHSPGPVAVSASTANFLGQFTTAGALTSLTARDIGNAPLNSFILTDGGLSTATTSITARVVNSATFGLAGILKSFKAVSVSGGSLTAQSFGSLTTTGLTAAGNLGDFSPILISTTPANGTVVGSATIAGTLGGVWELRGNVGTVKAFKTNQWNLGVPQGANLFNGGLFGGATSLTLGPVSNTIFNATGLIAKMTTSDITGSTLTAGSFGTVSVAANPALALAGSIGSSTLTALGNKAGVALASLSVAGNMGLSNLNFLNGNATSITVARIVNNSVFSAVDNGSFGNIGSITAGKWQNSTIDARALTNLKIVGNLLGGLFGDFLTSTVTIRNNTLGVGLGTFSAQGSVTGSTFDVQSGNLTNFLVGRQLGSTAIRLTNPVFGVLGTIQAGDWTSGDSVLAKTIGTVASVGAAEVFPVSPLLLGGIALDSITAYLNSGSLPAIGKLTTKGDFSGSTVVTKRGITTATVGRAVTLNAGINSFIIADDVLSGAPNVGRIGTLTAGAVTSSTVVANSLGTVKITGYTQPENPAATIVPGDVTSSNFQANGSAGATPAAAAGVGSMSVARFVQTNSVLKAPFGIKTLSITGGVVSSSQVVTDNPVLPTAGALGTFTVGEVASATIRTGSIALMKVAGYSPSNLLGSISSSTIAADSTAITKTGPQAIQSLTAAGSFLDSVLDAPATVGSIGIGGRVMSVALETRVQAGYNIGAKLGTLSAGAWGQAAATLTADLSTRAVGTFALKGNSPIGFVGTADRAFIDILGANAGVGLGTFTSTGTLSNSLFRVSDGDVTSFTALRLLSTDLLVGFRPVKGSDLSLAPSAANWSATNHKIGLFKTTAPFSATDPDNSASFVDSNVVAATLGAISISGVDPTTTNSTKFGVGFRATGGSAGSVVVAGSSKAVGFVDGQFNFLGLPG